MNNRIRELMEQASSNACYDEPGQIHLINNEIEKFAELIILESKCWIHKRIGPKTALDFLEHFGVEE